jgi:hypothetical protein
MPASNGTNAAMRTATCRRIRTFCAGGYRFETVFDARAPARDNFTMSPLYADGPWSAPRSHLRYAVDLLVRVRTSEARLVDRAVNLSKGGIAIRTADPLAPSTRVSLGVQLPPMLELVNVVGEVMWTDGVHMGLRFDEPDERVGDFVERLARDSERL